MKKQTIIALKFLLAMTVLTGIVYPLVMTGLAQVSFPSKANGSLIKKDGKIIGSDLIGQKFDSSVYFWSRPSAIGYNTIPSGASNYGPTSDTLKKQVKSRRVLFTKMNSVPDTTDIPVEMIFASGSGLDPHISPEAAILQVDRVVAARNFNESQKQHVLKLIKINSEQPQFYLFGEPRINVFKLNLALDNVK
ncbi:MAG: potassium-transporting ATPase subunit KdpC [Bacteroidales bacterium]|jgi:K+-transporting ATPase ATPase C chain